MNVHHRIWYSERILKLPIGNDAVTSIIMLESSLSKHRLTEWIDQRKI